MNSLLSSSSSPHSTMNSTNASSYNPSKKIKLTIIPPRQLFVNISSDEDVTTTPSPTTTSSSPTPPNAPLQSQPSLDVTFSLSPITPLDHIHDTPSPPSPPQPQPPIMGHPLFYNYHDYHGSTCICLKSEVEYSGSGVGTNRDGIFEIDLSNSNTNDSSMSTVSNKIAKLNLDSALLYHCRLGHISKKRIEKFQHGRLLNLTNLRAFEKCVSCMSGKMARKPYTHQVERAKDLLELIHTDVCGPFRTVLRQGASYFVTFTEYFSRYGYVYLLKHKHEVFETFRVFQKEVENQLGKTIKSLCSDREGEYMSQEFLDHLKEHGIIAHRTPPYTPQNKGVSERRNRTLLDTVRCMMSQTTLLKSFWDYALETAARILNMVPTKKVEKTPYKVWHGQALKLSYLEV
ncbi:retrotransposon protein, putative, ty1-copia subclass [Tanacetum coccineum]